MVKQSSHSIFLDPSQEKITGEGDKPLKIAAYSTAAGSLWDYGVQCDKIVGFWGPSTRGTYVTWHETQLGDVDTGCVEDITKSGIALDIDRISEVEPDILISNSYVDWDFSVDEDKLKQLDNPPPLLKMEVKNISALTLAQQYEQLVEELGYDPSPAAKHHCAAMEYSLEELRELGQRLQDRQIRVLAGFPRTDTIFLAHPTEDPVLNMLEQFGVPLIHVDVNTYSYFLLFSLLIFE